MKRQKYKRFFGEHIDIFSFNEGVVSPEYTNEIEKYFNELHSQIKKLKFSSLRPLCFWLSRKFKKYSIRFKEEEKIDYSTDPYVLLGIIKAGTKTNKKGVITIRCSEQLLQIQSSDKYFKSFLPAIIKIIGHELIHRKQMVQVEGIKLRNYIFDHENIKEIQKYLSNKQEVMARAWQIIEEFRYKGLNDNQILKILQTNKDTRIVAYSPTLMIYLDFFNIKDNVFKVLYKYIYLYLNSEIEENN